MTDRFVDVGCGVQSKLHMSDYTMEDWLQVERQLTRERGLWGPPVGSDLDKWMLDMTEGLLSVHIQFLSVIFLTRFETRLMV